MSFNMNDYIDVKQRINMFYSLYPEGSLQFTFKGTLDHDEEMIWGIAYAYRHPDDRLPAIGHAQEASKGRTGFTRGSELQNLETSAIGRAIGMLGIGIDVALATKDEVSLAQQRQVKPTQKGRPSADEYKGMTEQGGKLPLATEAQRKLIQRLAPGPAWIEDWKKEHGIEGPVDKPTASKMIEELQGLQVDKNIKNLEDYPRVMDGEDDV